MNFKTSDLELPFNMDKTKRLVVQTKLLDWIDSPSSKVRRKPLEREKEESGRVTSLVEYKPGAQFNSHSHPMGEEIFVISGEFADENGRYPQGTYIRNPPGSKHSPFSEKGCILFVKLDQFLETDDKKIVINTNAEPWLPGQGALKVKPLHSHGSENSALVLWPQGCKFKPHSHFGGEEIFVLNGVFQDELGNYPEHTWIRSPHMSNHNPFSDIGCLILVKTGHLD